MARDERPPACAALAAPGTGNLTLATPGELFDDFDLRAVRCAVTLGGGARVDVAVLSQTAIAAGGGDSNTAAFFDRWLKGEGLAGARFESVAGHWRTAHAQGDARPWRRIVVDDDGVLVTVVPQGLDAASGLEVTREIVAAMRVALP